MARHRLLFLTDRGAVHQREAARACPRELDLQILRAPREEEVLRAIGDADFLISERNQPVTRAMIEAAPRLALIVRLGSLHHDIDLHTAREAGVRVSVQPVPSSIAAAEHVLMMILAVEKRLGRGLSFVFDRPKLRPPSRPTREDQFAYNFEHLSDVRSLYQRSVYILGMGEIGVELARRLQLFFPRIVRYQKRSPYPPDVEHRLNIVFSPEEAALPDTEILVSLLPYTEQTIHKINGRLLRQLPPRASLVHAGSGGVLDEDAVLAALDIGQLRGAAIDTYEEEPLSMDHPLAIRARASNSNLLLTPHIASGTDTFDRRWDFTEIMRFLEGEPLQFELTERWRAAV